MRFSCRTEVRKELAENGAQDGSDDDGYIDLVRQSKKDKELAKKEAYDAAKLSDRYASSASYTDAS